MHRKWQCSDKAHCNSESEPIKTLLIYPALEHRDTSPWQPQECRETRIRSHSPHRLSCSYYSVCADAVRSWQLKWRWVTAGILLALVFSPVMQPWIRNQARKPIDIWAVYIISTGQWLTEMFALCVISKIYNSHVKGRGASQFTYLCSILCHFLL